MTKVTSARYAFAQDDVNRQLRRSRQPRLLLLHQFRGEFFHSVEVPFAAAELRDCFDAEYGTRLHERRNARLAQTPRNFFGIAVAVAFNKKHDTFTLDGIRHGGNRKFVFAHEACFCDAEFHSGERNHFAAELCKAAVATENLDESIFGDGALVAGLVPTASIDFDNNSVGLCFVSEVSLHDLRTRDGEHAFFTRSEELVRFRIDDGAGRTRDDHADTRVVAALFHRQEVVQQNVRDIERRERREFRATVPFVNILAELELERLAHLGAELFGAGDYKAQGVEAHRVYPAVDGDGAEERRGAHEDGRLVFSANTGKRLDVGGVWAEHYRNAIQKRHHERHRETERME